MAVSSDAPIAGSATDLKLRKVLVSAGTRTRAARRVWLRWIAAVTLGTSVAYTGAATAGYVFIRCERKIAGVEFADIALPWRWHHYRNARGDDYLAKAQKSATEGKYREAMIFARAGFERSPANRDGRLLLARLLLATRQVQPAREILLRGLIFHSHDPAYLQATLEFLAQQQDDETVVRIAQRFRPALSPDHAASRMLMTAAATACYHRGNYAGAEQFLRASPGVAQSRDGLLLAAKIERERGQAELARLSWEHLADRFPTDAEIHCEYVQQLRIAGRYDEARRVSLVFQIAHPEACAPRIELLHAYQQSGNESAVQREIEQFLQIFAHDHRALVGLADFAASSGNITLARRLEAHAELHRFPIEPYKLSVIEAAISAGDYVTVSEEMHGYLARPEERSGDYETVFASLQAIAALGRGDVTGATGFLKHFLDRNDLRAANLIAVAQRFTLLEAAPQAWQTLARAHEVDPLNEPALARLIELDLALDRVDALPAHVQDYVRMRRPSRDILRVVLHQLGSDMFIFSKDAPAALAAAQHALALNESTFHSR